MKDSIANNIRVFRKKKRITQAELSQKTGLSRNTIVNFENSKRDPRIKDLRKIANALNVPIEELISENGTDGSKE